MPGDGGAITTGQNGPFTLIDQEGNERTSRSFQGKYQLLYFGYSFCPDLCPTTLAVMAQAMDKMGTDADRIVPTFITIDPERDTPAALKTYMAAFGPRFVGLTGTVAEIAAVEKEYRAYARKEPSDSKGNYGFEHSSVIYLIGPDGRLISSYDELISPDALEKDLRAKISNVAALTRSDSIPRSTQ